MQREQLHATWYGLFQARICAMNALPNRSLGMLRFRSPAAMHDLAVGYGAFVPELGLRLDAERFARDEYEYFAAAGLFGLTVGLVGFALGINRGAWRYTSLSDLRAIMKAATIAVAIFIVAHFFLVRLEEIPRASVVIACVFVVILLSGSRAGYRLYRDQRDALRHRGDLRRGPKLVFPVGADDNADLFPKAISERGDSLFRVLGMIDERGRCTGRFIRNVAVLEGIDQWPKIVNCFEAQGVRPQALILMRSPEDYERHARTEHLIEFSSQSGIDLMRVPDLLRFQSLDQVIEVLPVQLEDLLQRPQLRLDQAQTASLIDGKKILITGFGVSIGSEIARQIARLKPCKLVVLDASAFLLYSVTAELSSAAGSFELRAVLCNVRERESVNRVFKEERPDIVIHAAALKHVPMLEALPLKGFFTNAIGTRNVAEATLDVGAGDSGTSGPRFVTVLFGNVVGSIGSVVLLFAQQIKAGDPVTVTHPEIELYFMAIPAACLLVLQAAARSMRSEERGGNIILDMGTPVEIVDLARNLIRLSGFCPDVDTKIIYTALRYGEKLLEELFDPGETLKPTGAPGILAASSRFIERTRIERIFDDLHQQVKGYDVAGALRLLEESEPSFNPNARITALMASDRSPSTKMFEERCQ